MSIEVSPRLRQLLNLDRAWRRVWRDRNTDFVVPPLIYLGVRSNPGGILESLAAELESGEYRPSDVRVLDVPKANHTTRPAGILDIKDRILYQALVDVAADDTAPGLLTEPVSFGFRVNPDQESDRFLLPGGFTEFRERVASEFAANLRFAVESDISAYFECINEHVLADILLGHNVDGSIVAALTRLLRHWNRLIPIGLPQGVWPSDFLGARVYLDRVDKAMLQKRHRFFRFSDDVRVMARSRLATRIALRDLVTQLRSMGLHVQSAKTKLLGPPEVERSINRLHERLAEREDLAELLDIDPYGYTSVEDTLQELAEEDITRSESLLDALMEEAYGDGTSPVFELCRTCITGYRRIKSANALETALDLLLKLPALTQELVRYLRIIAGDENAVTIKNGAIAALRHRTTIHAWQKHWLLHLLNAPPIRLKLSRSNVNYIFDLAVDRNAEWPVRIMAMRITGAMGDEAKKRELRDLYGGESDSDLQHAILRAIFRLPKPEVRRFYRLCEGSDPQTDLVITYLRDRL